MNTISIILPVYNSKEYLSDCFESLIKQTFKDFEAIIIDDCSTDGSDIFIEKYREKDDRFKNFRLDDNKGVGFCRNFGLTQAKGEYVYFLDSDDFLAEDALENIIKSADKDHITVGKIQRTYNSYVERVDLANDHVLEDASLDNWKKIGVLSCLIPKNLIDTHKLTFDENVVCYSEIPFITSIINSQEFFKVANNSVYFKRKRNDKITNPSLMQANVGQSISNFLVMYVQEKNKHKMDANVQRYLDREFLKLYRKKIVTYFVKQRRIPQYFSLLNDATLLLKKESIKKLPLHTKTEIKSIRSGNIKIYKTSLNSSRRIRKLKRMFKGKGKTFTQIYRTILLKLPIRKNLIVFESFLGKNYSDSPKYIYEYIQKNNLPYETVWIFNETGKKIPGNAKQVKRFSFLYYYYLARAKYWVSNSRMPKRLNKRKGNVYLQTWHGTPLKKLVFDMDNVLSANPNYKNDFYKQSRRWDYLIAANQYSSDIFRSAFKYEKEMLEFGYPRNDILYQKNNEKDILKLKERLKLPQDKKIILYAPTWRDNEYYGTGKYKFNIQLDLQKMKEKLGEEYIVLLRMHYFIADQIDVSEYDGFVYDFSKYDDIADLYLISDILITDYSSVFFDYANLRRPILFYTYDLEEYRDTLRGFYIDFENEAPGPLLRNTEEIIDSVLNIQNVNDEYRDKFQSFYEKICSWESGNATEKIVKEVFE